MASGQTPLRKRPYPLETDAPDVAADMHTLALNLDQVPNVNSGTTLPATGMVAGDEFLLTTTDVWYKYDGTTWNPMMGVTGWQLLTMVSPWATSATAGRKLQCRMEGDLLRLRGVASPSTAETGGEIATLPAGLPTGSNNPLFVVPNNTGSYGIAVCSISGTGLYLSGLTVNSGGTLSFDQIAVPLS